MTTPSVAVARECLIRGQVLAYKEWGVQGQPVALCLHGWLDNAASFDALASHLTGHRLIAVDMPGHGLSGHRPPGGTYNIWDDLPDLSLLMDALGVDRFDLIGHSRGAMIASLLASVDPDRVRSLVLLDGINAPGFEAAKTVDQLRRFVHDYGRRQPGAGKLYASVDAAVDARCRSTDIDPDAARQLVPRSLVAVEGGYRWRNDPRLRYASALKFSSEQSLALLDAIQAPVLMVLATRGHGPRIAQLPYARALRALETLDIAGCHHCHMLSQSTEIATRIGGFWRAHASS